MFRPLGVIGSALYNGRMRRIVLLLLLVTALARPTQPPKSSFVTVQGVRLNMLDWGGKGEALVFLNGWGDSAHCFDDLAPKFVDRFHCVGFTRRGYGLSDKPKHGYDASTLASEIRGFMDAAHLQRAILVGHSAAGVLMTTVASKWPERIDKIVYLDAVYDYGLPECAAMWKIAAKISFPSVSRRDLASMSAYRSYTKTSFIAGFPPKPFWSNALETEMRELVTVDGKGAVRLRTSPAQEAGWFDELHASLEKAHIDYSKVRCPCLAFVAVNDFPSEMIPPMPESARPALERFAYDGLLPFQAAAVREFEQGVAHGRVITLPDTHHYCFVQRLDQVAGEMRKFLEE